MAPERQSDGFNVDSERVYRWHAGLPDEVSQFRESVEPAPAQPSELEGSNPQHYSPHEATTGHVDRAEGTGQTPGSEKRRRRTRRSQQAADVTSTAMDPSKPGALHEPWLSRKEAAEYLGGIHVNTLDKLVRDGKIRPLRITDRNLVYPLSELERFVREQHAQPPLGPVVPPPPPEPRRRRPRAQSWRAPS